ncbi:hypothetical protein ACIBM7_45850, partial [Streptomyces atratus]
MQTDHRPPYGSRQAHLQQLQIGSKCPYGDLRTAGDRGQPPPACRTCQLRRAIVVLMSAQGQTVKDITVLMQVSEDYVR